MFYYNEWITLWHNKVINDGPSNIQDDYVYYYIHPFGRLNIKATMSHIIIYDVSYRCFYV